MIINALVILGIGLFIAFFFGFCIFVHELGHLLVALWRRLFVERFSVGFGRRIWGVRWRDVDFVVSMLPFGGYVALPQLDPTDDPRDSQGTPLPQARPVDRMLTAVAGPLANLLLGFLLATVVWRVGIYRSAPAPFCDVITVPEDCPEYAAGLRQGDRVTAVNGKGFSRGWRELSELIVLTPGEITLSVLRNGEATNVRYVPAPNDIAEGLGYPFFDVRVPTVIKGLRDGWPGQAAGLKPGDVILELDGEAVADSSSFIDRITASEGEELALVVERDGERVVITGLRAQERQEEGRTVYRIGADLAAPSVLTYPSPWEQFVYVLTRTGETVRLLFKSDSLVKPRHLSGPVGIAQQIGMKVYMGGIREGLFFIVFLSFSLALLNILPIPVLDGGHIVFAAVEMVVRRRVPRRLAYALQTAFAVMLIGLMLYITVYDVRRVGALYRFFRPQAVEEAASTDSDPVADP